MTTEEGFIKTKEKIEKTEKSITKWKDKIEKAPLNFDKITKDAYEGREQRYFDVVVESYKEELRGTENKLKKLKELLVKYSIKKNIEDKKKSMPTIPIIEKFLDIWVINSKEFYNERRVACKNYLEHIKKERDEFCKENNIRANDYSMEVHNLLRENELDHASISKDMSRLFPQIVNEFVYRSDSDWKDSLEIMINKERETKKYLFYKRIIEKVGNITDAHGLRIGDNGEINGFIIGDKGKATIDTITAGGYNIQCLHFRVLVNKIKEK